MSSYDTIPGFGLLYDSVPAYQARRDVEFYVGEALKAGGPVLELGSGTGRVLLPMARAGATVTGLERSAHMLERCREKLAAEDRATRARVTLSEGDVRKVDLGTTFALVIMPFRVFQHVVTIEDQLDCLRSVARHLAPGGRFIFDVFNPRFDLLAADRSAELEETPEVELFDGRTLRRAFRIANVRWLDQVSEVELIYYVAPHAGAPAERHVQAFEMRWFLRAELVHLLARAGLSVTELLGDFDRSPLVDGTPEMIIGARRADHEH